MKLLFLLLVTLGLAGCTIEAIQPASIQDMQHFQAQLAREIRNAWNPPKACIDKDIHARGVLDPTVSISSVVIITSSGDLTCDASVEALAGSIVHVPADPTFFQKVRILRIRFTAQAE